jgi:hypothetical protein
MRPGADEEARFAGVGIDAFGGMVAGLNADIGSPVILPDGAECGAFLFYRV